MVSVQSCDFLLLVSTPAQAHTRNVALTKLIHKLTITKQCLLYDNKNVEALRSNVWDFVSSSVEDSKLQPAETSPMCQP